MPPRRTSPRPVADAAERTRAYFADQSPSARRGLRLLEATIRAAVPDAEPAFSYGIPGFRFADRPLVWYAAWADHWSVYPITAAMRAAGGTELARHAASKGTLSFPASAALPARFIMRLVKARAAEIRAARKVAARPARARRAAAKRAGAKRSR